MTDVTILCDGNSYLFICIETHYPNDLFQNKMVKAAVKGARARTRTRRKRRSRRDQGKNLEYLRALDVAQFQCDQIARLFVYYLAIFNNENLPNLILNLPK